MIFKGKSTGEMVFCNPGNFTHGSRWIASLCLYGLIENRCVLLLLTRTSANLCYKIGLSPILFQKSYPAITKTCIPNRYIENFLEGDYEGNLTANHSKPLPGKPPRCLCQLNHHELFH
jgi:hypothetical protein